MHIQKTHKIMTFRVLLQIPSIMFWTTSQVANIIGAVSTAATVATLASAPYQERKNSKKINDLAQIADEPREQNRMTKIQLKQFHFLNFTKFGSWQMQ